MAYDLRAVIADGELLRGVVGELPAARLASIGQGLSLMPVTDELFDSVTDGGGVGTLGFWGLPGGFEENLAAWSAGGPVAYVEAEYFGGVGEQRAAVWNGGRIVLGPLHVEEGEPFPSGGSPISQALRRLGVVASAGEDEFAAVGLDRHRHSEAWIA
ncbi:hypothetical protein [Streptomyces griseosporeus]|uniref:hypothetical protein n=1 Tax=Streptomyces griseosporeus TaxID=1910 RepID=UPI00167DD32A|nr:hypothetical protein [Streptomyces griseosporeus]GHF51637.1 hypothetical protein GCM10018783_20400 [Streptomyces griseosporeus]